MPRANAIGYAKFYSRSHDAVIRVYDAAGNMFGTHEHKDHYFINVAALARRRTCWFIASFLRKVFGSVDLCAVDPKMD